MNTSPAQTQTTESINKPLWRERYQNIARRLHGFEGDKKRGTAERIRKDAALIMHTIFLATTDSAVTLAQFEREVLA